MVERVCVFPVFLVYFVCLCYFVAPTAYSPAEIFIPLVARD